MRDTATKAEIGYVPSQKVIVVAPYADNARRWADNHGLSPHDIIFCGPRNWLEALRGIRGAQHVILHWADSAFDGHREHIKDQLRLTDSVPYDGEEPDDVDAGCADLRS